MPYPVYRIFVSSTFLDLAPERKQVAQAIDDLNASCGILRVALVPIDLQRGADTRPPLEVCLNEVRHSDVLVTIVGKCYGSVAPQGLSYTELEFDEAAHSKLERLAYYKNDSAFFLPEHVETDPERVEKLQSLRKKIDSRMKRDSFANADELRGHIIRDLMKWTLARPEVASSIPVSIAAAAFAGSKVLFDAFAAGKWNEAAALLSSREVILDMRRFGLGNLYLSLLRDLLELGSLAAPTRITEPKLRASLLLKYVRSAGDSFAAGVALEQAAALESTVKDKHYSFDVVRAKAESIITESRRFDIALPILKNMLRCARTTRDLHVVAQGMCTVGMNYSLKGNHTRALKWYWKSITILCWMPEMCPFCLCDAFIAAGNEHMALGDCTLANDRFGKGLMIALLIPNRDRQAKALHCLARHLTWHNELRAGIAAYVWLSRVCKEIDPRREDADLNVLLGEAVVKYGWNLVEQYLREVEGNPQEVLEKALLPYELKDFTKKLKLKRSYAGDHW